MQALLNVYSGENLAQKQGQGGAPGAYRPRVSGAQAPSQEARSDRKKSKSPWPRALGDPQGRDPLESCAPSGYPPMAIRIHEPKRSSRYALGVSPTTVEEENR
jgi:hypothetical protein